MFGGEKRLLREKTEEEVLEEETEGKREGTRGGEEKRKERERRRGISIESGLRILIRAPEVPFLVLAKTPEIGHFGCFWPIWYFY